MTAYDPDAYRLADADRLRTPALLIFPAHVDANIAATLSLVGGDANRLRPHLKTAKLAWTMRRWVEHGVRQCKCATTLEVETACRAGFDDVLLAYAAVGQRARRARQLADVTPDVRLSALIEDCEALSIWRGGRVGLFIDVNSGMDRTGIPVERHAEIVALAHAIVDAGLEFRGLHFYDGHAGSFPAATAAAQVVAGYEALRACFAAVRGAGLEVGEVVTAGTPAYPHAAGYRGLLDDGVTHRLSPGTLVYCDTTSLAQLPAAGFRPAALVLSTVVSHPLATRATCDAGHKTVSADAGVPTCSVVGRPHLTPLKPSEEHLPLDAPDEASRPSRGEYLYLVPRHVCPTVNNFDHAVLVVDGRIAGVEPVSARGREHPLAIGD
jgi:D-serine deaminase-like pyridoxal phosphate-dependent protein